jgi:four helix bundle protein
LAVVREFVSKIPLFPDVEKFGLVSKIRRAVISIPVNIAEGAGRGSKKELSPFLQIAAGVL